MSATSHKIATAHPEGMPKKIIKALKGTTVYTANEVFCNAKIKYTPDGLYKITCFNKPRYKLEGYEYNESWDRADILQHADEKPFKPYRTDDDKIKDIKDSLKRAKDKIFEISACNDWDYMVTFTLDKDKVDRYNPDEVQNKFAKWLDNMVQRKGLCALIVPELHQDGAIHFHGLINNALKMTFSDTYKIKGCKHPVKASTLRKKGKKTTDSDVKAVYNVVDYKLGFSTAVPLDENVSAVSFYMTKYATKDLGKIFGNYYIAVGKIKRTLPYFLCNLDFDKLAEGGTLVKLPENFGQVCYATITKDNFEGDLNNGN